MGPCGSHSVLQSRHAHEKTLIQQGLTKGIQDCFLFTHHLLAVSLSGNVLLTVPVSYNKHKSFTIDV